MRLLRQLKTITLKEGRLLVNQNDKSPRDQATWENRVKQEFDENPAPEFSPYEEAL